MATIALYANQISQMSGRIKTVQSAVTDYKEKLLSLQKQALTINKSTCELDEVIASIKTSTQTQDDKNEALSTFITESEEFIGEAERIDCDVRDVINERKNNFYEEYEYLRPECEKKEEKKSVDATIWGGIKSVGKTLKKAGEWCKAHWKELLATTLIVIGVIAAIVVIVGSKGLALAPVLTALLTAFGVAASTAATIATVTSIAIATIAVISLIGSATLNIIDTWKDMSENPTFKKWQTALNITSAVSNTIYSIGEILSLLCIKMGIVPKSGAGVGTGFMDDVVEGGTGIRVTSSLGNEIDITPSSNHSTITKNPGYKGMPNSSIDILDSNGNVSTRRWYDSNGNAYRDVDMTNHGNSATHPDWPHEHIWKYGEDGKPIGR